jgi:hypothetical protein
MFSAAHPEVLQILAHEGAVDSPRIHHVLDRFVKPLRPLVERRIDRLVAAGRLRPVPYATVHYLVTHGGGAPFASHVETALLGGPRRSDPDEVRRHAEAVADILIAGLTPPAT